MSEFLSDILTGLYILSGIGGVSFTVAALARFGWDWAGLHTRKAQIVHTYHFAKKVKTDE